MPDLHPGTIEEIDQGDGCVRVRHDAWDGGPSVLSTWFLDISPLRPLPAGFIRPPPTALERLEAARFCGAIEEAMEGMFDV